MARRNHKDKERYSHVIPVRLPPGLWKNVQGAAAVKSIPASVLIRELLVELFGKK